MQRAVRKNPKAPDFAGLEAYTRHMQATGGVAFAPVFDKPPPELQRAESFTMNNERLIREEVSTQANHYFAWSP